MKDEFDLQKKNVWNKKDSERVINPSLSNLKNLKIALSQNEMGHTGRATSHTQEGGL